MTEKTMYISVVNLFKRRKADQAGADLEWKIEHWTS